MIREPIFSECHENSYFSGYLKVYQAKLTFEGVIFFFERIVFMWNKVILIGLLDRICAHSSCCLGTTD